MAEPTNPPAWHVTGQVEALEPGPNGNYVRGWRISYTTAGGTVGSVFVPKNIYSAAGVSQAINAEVNVVSNVEKLQG